MMMMMMGRRKIPEQNFVEGEKSVNDESIKQNPEASELLPGAESYPNLIPVQSMRTLA